MTMLSKRPYTFDRVVRLIISLVVIMGVLWLIDSLRGVLLPFLVACLIAYVFEPVVQWFMKVMKVKRRFLPVVVTLLACTLIFGGLCYWFIPQIIDEMHQVGGMIREYIMSESSSPLLPDSVNKELRSSSILATVAHRLAAQDSEFVMQKVSELLSGSIDVLLSMVDWLLMFIYVIFIMLDYENLMDGFKLMIPISVRPKVVRIIRDVKVNMNHYFRGQALIACVIAVLYSVGFTIIGLPLAVVIGVTIGVLFMIPYMQYITLVPVTLLCMVVAADDNVSFWTIWWECIALYAVCEIIADLILTPKIMGKAMGLNPAVILLSLSVWGSLLGIVGMIIALPLTTLLIGYYNDFLNRHAPAGTPDDSLLKDLSE